TQTPKDVPSDVLAQIGSRVQHQLRAHTPDDARALKSTVSTYPTSGYDLQQVLTNLATGEAIVTVMNENGAPTPVAWTRLRAPQGSMGATPVDQVQATVSASPLMASYGTVVDPVSARELLAGRMNAVADADAAQQRAVDQARQQAADQAKQQAVDQARAQAELQRDYEKTQRELQRTRTRTEATRTTSTRSTARKQKTAAEEILGSTTTKTVVREVLRGIFGTLRKR
ncbi:MAG: double-strand break repair helicase HerA and related ATPase, partial [Actinomycetota bacterium]|nr:double-strand break repair helicase HerA and related ATPase [Actinomycetota bacterium]